MRRRTTVRALRTAAWVLALVFAAPALAADYIYSYNEADQLKTGRRSDSLYSTSFTYDGDGIRLKTTQLTPSGVISSETIYVYDAFGNVIAEYDSAGQLLADYVWVNGQRICKIAAGEQRTYYHTGPGGSTLALSNAAGQIIGRSDYQPFGAVNASSGTTDKYAFMGKDSAFGLYYFGARWYDPATGRFAAPDPVAGRLDTPETLNRYAYALNNPNKFQDPDGELFDTLLDIGFIGYDAYRIVADNVVGQKGNFKENMLALGGDVGGALVPVLTGVGAGIRAARHADEAVKLADGAIDVLRAADLGADAAKVASSESRGFLAYTARNLRQNLARLSGRIEDGTHAHHMLPKAFAESFEAAGLNVHDPAFGTWWEKASHLGNAADYNRRWQEFLRASPNKEQILDFARGLGQEYGLKVSF
jgi:RHS repeat-associated protein